MQWQSGRYEAKHKSGGWLPGLQHPCIHPGSLSTKCFTISPASILLAQKQSSLHKEDTKGYTYDFQGMRPLRMVMWKSRGRAKPCHPSEIEGGSHRLTDPPLCPNKSSLLWQLGNWKASVAVFKNCCKMFHLHCSIRCLAIWTSPRNNLIKVSPKLNKTITNPETHLGFH